MRRPALHPTLLLAALAATMLLPSGCDDVRFQPGARSAQPPVFQPRTMRSLVSPQGLERLYRAEHPGGITLAYPSETSDAFGLDLTLGPIDRQVSVQTWQVAAQPDALTVSIESNNVAVTVPVRIAEGVGARICRYSVEADRASIESDVALGHDGDVPTFEAVGGRTVDLSNPQVSLIGDCPPLEAQAEDDAFAVEQLFVDYLERAWTESGRQAIAIAPLDSLGLVHSVVGLHRLSSFENRRGQLQVSGRVTQSNGSSLSPEGFDVDLDMALNSRRADCAPARDPEAPATLSADEVPAAEVERAGADVGIAVAAPLVLRLAQTSTLAGFGCRGLENLSFDGGGSNVATDDLMLEDVGLGELPIGAWVEPVVVPGELPELEMDPVNGTIELAWNDLSVDLYAQMQEVPVRIAQVTATVIVSLRPTERLDSIAFTVDSVFVSAASVQSQWSYEVPFDSDLVRWTRRTMMLVLEDAFSLPIPLDPSAPLHLIDSQVRANDVLLFFEFDRLF